MATFIYDGTPIPITASGTLHYVAVDAAGNYVEGSADYVIVTALAVSDLYMTLSGSNVATIHYTTVAYGGWTAQPIQVESSTGKISLSGVGTTTQIKQSDQSAGSLKLTGTVVESQIKQSEQIAATVKINAAASFTQVKQSISSIAAIGITGQAVTSQPKQYEAIDANTTVVDPVIEFINQDPDHVITIDTNLILRYTTAEIIYGIIGTASTAQTLQQVYASAALMLSGDVITQQPCQFEQINAIATVSGVAEMVQPIQVVDAIGLIRTNWAETSQSIQTMAASGTLAITGVAETNQTKQRISAYSRGASTVKSIDITGSVPAVSILGSIISPISIIGSSDQLSILGSLQYPINIKGLVSD